MGGTGGVAVSSPLQEQWLLAALPQLGWALLGAPRGGSAFTAAQQLWVCVPGRRRAGQRWQWDVQPGQGRL